MFVYEFMQVYLDCYMNTIDGMQNEMNSYGYCNMFEYNYDFVNFF